MNPPKDPQYNPGAAGPSWGVDANSEGGGIWQNTSAKREKLGELRGEMPEGAVSHGMDLEDMCTEAERSEINLIDGINAVVSFVDVGGSFDKSSIRGVTGREGYQLAGYLNSLKAGERSYSEKKLNGITFVRHIGLAKEKLGAQPPLGDLSFWGEVGNFGVVEYDDDELVEDDKKEDDNKPAPDPKKPKYEQFLKLSFTERDPLSNAQQNAFADAVSHFRYHLAVSTLDYFGSRYEALTTFHDRDIDRAAVHEVTLDKEGLRVDSDKLDRVLQAFVMGRCVASDQREALLINRRFAPSPTN